MLIPALLLFIMAPGVSSSADLHGGTAPTLVVGNALGPPGSTRSIAFTLNAGTESVGGVQFELAIPVELRANAASAVGPGAGIGVICSTPELDVLICLAFRNNGGALPTTVVINVNFTVEIAAPFGPVPLNLTNVEFSDPGGIIVQPGIHTQGVFHIVQAGPGIFVSQPAPDTLIDFGNVLHGELAERNVRVSNGAAPDFQPLTISTCSVAGSTAWVLQEPAAFPVTVIAGAQTDLIVRMNSSADLPNLVQGNLACVVQTNMTFNVSWPLQAFAVPQSIFFDGFE